MKLKKNKESGKKNDISLMFTTYYMLDMILAKVYMLF